MINLENEQSERVVGFVVVPGQRAAATPLTLLKPCGRLTVLILLGAGMSGHWY
jgi:hypothetical protein